MGRLFVRSEFIRVTGALIGELHPRHDHGLVSKQIAIPVLKIPDLLFSQPRKDVSDSAQRVPVMVGGIAQSVDDTEKQKNGRISVGEDRSAAGNAFDLPCDAAGVTVWIEASTSDLTA
jgi:hypothetical protein